MDARELKTEAACEALRSVRPGMRLGIGTGATAEAFIRLLAERVGSGLDIKGVATSTRTAGLCRKLGVPLFSLDELPELDLTVDGADEIDGALRLIKGGGGALLREKIVAHASRRMIVIADESKVVDRLGGFPLPIEVSPFGLAATRVAVEKAAASVGLRGELRLRMNRDAPFETDDGHYIVDASFDPIADAEALARALAGIPGVIEHGLFLGIASMAVIAGQSGIRTLGSKGNPTT